MPSQIQSTSVLDHLKDETEASYRVAETTAEFFIQESMVLNRLRYTKRAIIHSLANVTAEDSQNLRRLMLHPDTAHYFHGTSFSPHDTTHEQVATETALLNMNGSLSFVATMALIYTHSYVEDFLMRLLRLVTLKNPAIWMNRLGERKISLASLASNTVEKLAGQKLEDYFKELEEKGLIRKIEILKEVNQTSDLPSPVRDFVYDAAEVTRLDLLRHDFADRRQSNYDIEAAERDIAYLFRTAFHFHALTVQKHGIQASARPNP